MGLRGPRRVGRDAALLLRRRAAQLDAADAVRGDGREHAVPRADGGRRAEPAPRVRVLAHAAIAPMVGPFAHFASVASNWCLAIFPHRAIHFGWASLLKSHPHPHEWDYQVSSMLASDAQLSRSSPAIVTYHEYDTLYDEGR